MQYSTFLWILSVKKNFCRKGNAIINATQKVFCLNIWETPVDFLNLSRMLFWVWNDCRSDVNEKRVLRLVEALRSRLIEFWIRLNSRTVMWSEQEFDLRLTSRDSSRSLIMKSERDCEISYGSKYKHSITERHYGQDMSLLSDWCKENIQNTL